MHVAVALPGQPHGCERGECGGLNGLKMQQQVAFITMHMAVDLWHCLGSLTAASEVIVVLMAEICSK